MKYLIKFCFLFFSICLIVSCSKNTDYNFFIKNDRSGRIYVQYKMYDEDSIETIQLLPNTYQRIGYDMQLGGKPTIINPDVYIDSLFIVSDSGLVCTKNYKDSTEWTVFKAEKRQGGEYTQDYYFIVSDNDF